MKKIYIGYSDFTNSLYCFSKKDRGDKQDVTEQFEHIVRNVCKLNDTKEIKIGDLVLEVKENADADKKLYDKAVDDLSSIASGTPKEIDAMTTPWIAGYRKGIEEMKKEACEFAILKTAILKLRNCENCKYHSFWGDELKCNYGLKEALQEDKLVECHNLDKWEMKE